MEKLSVLIQIEFQNIQRWEEFNYHESCGFYEEKQITHYCIVTSEELIDILTTFKPSIKVSQISTVEDHWKK